MASIFKDKKILLVNENDSSRKMLAAILKMLGCTNTDEAFEPSDAYRKFQDGNHDVIIAPLSNGVSDCIGLARLVRRDASSPNTSAPIVAIGGPNSLPFLDAARELGITDFLQAPYGVDDVAERLKFALGMQQEQLAAAAQPQAAPKIEESAEPTEPWPEEEEALSLTDMLLDHYIKHHEIVFAKLKFAQSATQKCIQDVRTTHEKVKSLDNTNIHQFSDFEQMWEEILSTFVQGGMSEEELFEIEQTITRIPPDIKKHYDDLSQQDKSFLTLVESLNSSAYQKAKTKAISLQNQPSSFNGLATQDYKEAAKSTNDGEDDSGVYIYNPT